MPDTNYPAAEFYCPTCAKTVPDPLVRGDCHALIRRTRGTCGTPLDRICGCGGR